MGTWMIHFLLPALKSQHLVCVGGAISCTSPFLLREAPEWVRLFWVN